MRPTIYLAQSGLGKTYFCQHNLGWLDLDPYPILSCGLNNTDAERCFLEMIGFNLYWGYKIVIPATGWIIDTLLKADRFNLVILYSPLEMKDEICQRLKDRAAALNNSKDKWVQACDKLFESNLRAVLNVNHPSITKIQVKPGEYVSDYLGKNNESLYCNMWNR